ncbi:MAG: UTP--glucose-1-phosphate uridylyltransferase GalU [Actinobacteria bacterium]|nr:UTP--glucose-1-phosphate uridylyltransferase GalU [Actinomycetota bacterium]
MTTTTHVNKAVIPAAGFGTRFLPATKAQAKEMMPIVDKPVIQYIVEEAVAAGIDDILIITGYTKRSIEDHFDRQFELEQALIETGKDKELAEVVGLASLANIHFVRQGERLGLGHAIAVARNHVGDNPFVVMLGDEFMAPRTNLLTEMIQTHSQYGRSVLALQEVAEDEISRYGCAKPERISDRLIQILDIVEKPQPSEAPSNLAVMGRYVFTPEIFDKLEQVQPGVGGEIQLTDAIAMLLADQAVYGVTFDGGRYDTGTVPAYLETIVELALERESLREEFGDFLIEALQRHGRL